MGLTCLPAASLHKTDENTKKNNTKKQRALRHKTCLHLPPTARAPIRQIFTPTWNQAVVDFADPTTFTPRRCFFAQLPYFCHDRLPLPRVTHARSHFMVNISRAGHDTTAAKKKHPRASSPAKYLVDDVAVKQVDIGRVVKLVLFGKGCTGAHGSIALLARTLAQPCTE